MVDTNIVVTNGSPVMFSPASVNDYFTFTNGVFTCQKAGYYSFSIGIHGLIKANDFLIVSINGSQESNFGTSITGIASDTQFKSNISVTEYLRLNDAFSIVITSNNGNATMVYGRSATVSTGLFIKPLLIE